MRRWRRPGDACSATEPLLHLFGRSVTRPESHPFLLDGTHASAEASGGRGWIAGRRVESVGRERPIIGG